MLRTIQTDKAMHKCLQGAQTNISATCGNMPYFATGVFREDQGDHAPQGQNAITLVSW